MQTLLHKIPAACFYQSFFNWHMANCIHLHDNFTTKFDFMNCCFCLAFSCMVLMFTGPSGDDENLGLHPWLNLGPPSWLNLGLCPWLNLGLHPWLNLGPPPWLNLGFCPWLNLGLCPWLNLGLCPWFKLGLCPWLNLGLDLI